MCCCTDFSCFSACGLLNFLDCRFIVFIKFLKFWPLFFPISFVLQVFFFYLWSQPCVSFGYCSAYSSLVVLSLAVCVRACAHTLHSMQNLSSLVVWPANSNNLGLPKFSTLCPQLREATRLCFLFPFPALCSVNFPDSKLRQSQGLLHLFHFSQGSLSCTDSCPKSRNIGPYIFTLFSCFRFGGVLSCFVFSFFKMRR